MADAQLQKPWAHSLEEITDALDVDPGAGLSRQEVERRREKHGPNRLRRSETRGAWDILVDQFKSVVILILAAAALLSFGLQEWIDGSAIIIAILLNAGIGFFTELRAVRSMEALQELGSDDARVRRDGQESSVPAELLVPGDVVIVGGGNVITADLYLFEASKLQANESALTGESTPVTKKVESLAEDTQLAERHNMLFKGTAVTRGAGKGIVVHTGMDTELGQISSLVEEAESDHTPLERRIDDLGRKLVWITLAILVAVAIAGILRGRSIRLMVETAVALAVAAVPEGLPIVATVALARGMMRMAERNALVNRLASVETLGSTNVICTDKTGTLTENQMTVTQLVLPTGTYEVSGDGLEIDGAFRSSGEEIDPHAHKPVEQALRTGVLCNNASLDDDGGDMVGDPVEIALLVAGRKAGMRRDELLESLPEEREVAFDTDVKMMATFHETDGPMLVAVKGAPEAVLGACARIGGEESPQELNDEHRKEWLSRSEGMAEDGLRVLALASKDAESAEEDPYTGLTFLGLAGLLDPPREEVHGAIQSAQEAGVRVVMVTGDHPVTARKVARAVGLIGENGGESLRGEEITNLGDSKADRLARADILARVSPAQKLDLIDAHQARNKIVAMTGDGVNDAPALKSADIGIAMGQRGTQVAQDAADMVLQDDSFATIVSAIEQGRVIFENIRKFVVYLSICHLSEILVVFLASMVNAPLPLTPLQILFINLVTDVFPALALGVGEGPPSIMQQPPREKNEPILTRQHWMRVAGYGVVISAVTLGALALALQWLELPVEQAVTISFLTLGFSQMLHVFNMRERESGMWRNEVTENRYVWGALVVCTILFLLAVYLPGLSDVLNTVAPGPQGWGIVAGMGVIPLILGQIWLALRD